MTDIKIRKSHLLLARIEYIVFRKMLLLLIAVSTTLLVTAQSPTERYVRTYQTAVILNGSVPFDELVTTSQLAGESDLKTAVSYLNGYKNNEYGIKVLIPPGCDGCKVEVAVYDSEIFEKKTNDIFDYDGLIYGIYADITSLGNPAWERKFFNVHNCLYGNLGHLDQLNIVDANGDFICPGYIRQSDEWLPSYYASSMEYLKREHPLDKLRRPMKIENLPVILRVTITEGSLGSDFAIKNANFIDSDIPGIGKVTDYFNFDKPQERIPLITSDQNRGDGTVGFEDNFIDDNDNSLFTQSNNGWKKPLDDEDYNTKKFYVLESKECDGRDWPEEEVYTWVAKYEVGTQFENEVNFHILNSDVKRNVQVCTSSIDPFTGLVVETCNTVTLNPSKEEIAEIDSRVYQNAVNLGRIPRILRRGVTDIYFNTISGFTGGGCPTNTKAIRLELKATNTQYAELLLHEAVHVTFDEFVREFILDDGTLATNYPGDPRWAKAIKSDGRNYSEYVQLSQNTMIEEQVSEHFAVFLWLRTGYFKDRKFPKLYTGYPVKAEREAKLFRNQVIDFMQNRIYYFENHLLERPYNGITYSSMQEAIYPLTDNGKVLNDVSNTQTRVAHVIQADSQGEEKNSEEQFGVLIYPNPSSGNFVVRMNIEDAGNYKGYLYNSIGKIVHKVAWQFDFGGTYERPIQGLKNKELGNGLYFLSVFGPEGKVVEPVIIQN